VTARDYDVSLRQNLMDAFGKAVDNLAPYGRKEVVDAAAECLIIAMHQDLRRFLPPNQAEVLKARRWFVSYPLPSLEPWQRPRRS
jgi:hypothetical protein